MLTLELATMVVRLSGLPDFQVVELRQVPMSHDATVGLNIFLLRLQYGSPPAAVCRPGVYGTGYV